MAKKEAIIKITFSDDPDNPYPTLLVKRPDGLQDVEEELLDKIISVVQYEMEA